MRIRDVKQLPADFKPANTSPQLTGPYPGRNATRGYLVGEDQQTDLGSVFEPNIERTPEYQRGYQSAATAENPYQEGTTQWTRWLKGRTDKIGPRSKLRPEFGGLPQGSLDKPVSEIYNPVDQERQEQRAMDREREQFKRDELEFELRGEEERMRAANEGTFYLRIDGRIWNKSGQPVSFPNRERAVRAGQTIKDRDPGREVVVTRTPQDKDMLDEIDRRGFLKGLGAVAAGAALAKVPGQAQAKDPSGWTGDPSDVKGRARWIQAGRPGPDNNPARRSYPEASFDRNNNTISYQGRNYRVQNVRTPDQISGAQSVAIPLAQLGQRSSSSRLYNLTPDGKAYSTSQTVRESRDPTYEDILTSLQKKLGDYLQDVATAVQRDPDLLDKLPKQVSGIQAVKTIRTDDGHEIKIHGNEDDGFRISIRNRDIKTSFEDLDEAVMACEIYCARRRHKDYLDEKSVTESYSEQEYAQAMQDFLARGGKIEKGVYKEPKLATRLRRQGSRHIGQGSEGRAGQLAGRGANIGGTGKPVVSVEETKKDACYNKVKSRYKVWPSAYASGALVQCRKQGAANWGKKSKVTEGWRETLAGLAAAGIMALSPGISAADVAADSQQVPMIATIVVGGEVKKLDLTAKGFRDVREAEKFFDEFFGRRGMPWQGKIERGTPGSGQYQRIIVQ